MSTTTLLAIIASTWGIAMALSPTLQIRHMIAIRSSAGISIPYLGVLVIGFALWFAYGIALGNLALIISRTRSRSSSARRRSPSRGTTGRAA